MKSLNNWLNYSTIEGVPFHPLSQPAGKAAEAGKAGKYLRYLKGLSLLIGCDRGLVDWLPQEELRAKTIPDRVGIFSRDQI